MSFSFDQVYLRNSEYSVAMIVANPVRGDSRVLKTAYSLSKRGYRIHLFGMNKVPASEQIEGYPFRVTLVPNPMYGLRHDGFWRSMQEDEQFKVFVERLILAFKNVIEGQQYDFLHTHDMYGLPIGAELHEKCGIGEAGWVHDLHEYVEGCTNIPEHKRIFLLLQENEHISKPDALTSVSPILSNLIAQRYQILPPHLVLNTPRRSDFDPFYSKPIRSALEIDDDVPLLVYNGNVKPERGVHYAFEALSRLPEIHLALITNSASEYVNELINSAGKNGLDKRIHIHPYVPNCDVTSFLQGATAGINPVTLYENSDLALPNKLFEYIHAGAPIVSSDTTAMRDFIAKHDCGITFPAGDSMRFAEAVEEVLLRYPKELLTVAQGSQLAQQYCWEEQEKVILSIYEQLLPKHQQTFTENCSSDVEPIVNLPTHAANQPGTLTRAMTKIGLQAKNAALGKNNFRYNNDISIESQKNTLSAVQSYFKQQDIGSFTTYHFHVRPLLYDKYFSFPTGFDLVLLKAMGKRVFFHFRGSEVRLNSVFKVSSPYNYVDDQEGSKNQGMPYNFTEKNQIAFRNFILGVCDGVFVNDPEIQCYVPNTVIVPRAVDSEIFDKGENENERTVPLIVHAPSRPGVKGTESIVASIEQLRKEGFNFDFKLIKNMPHKETMEVYQEATIVIDQLRIGWYGVAAVEAMAMGKAVISYVRNDLRHYLPSPSPLAFANPDNLPEVLRYLLKNPEAVRRYGELARNFAKAQHKAEDIATLLIDIYRKPTKEIDPIAATDFLLYQIEGEKEKAHKEKTAFPSKVKGNAAKPVGTKSDKQKKVVSPKANKYPKKTDFVPMPKRHYVREFILVARGDGLFAAFGKSFGVIKRYLSK